MKTRYILSLMLLALLLNSCSVTTMFKSSEKSMGRQAESNGNTVALVNKPILADLTVSMTRQSIIFTTTNLELNNSSMDIQSAGTTSMVQGGEMNYLKGEAKKRAQFQFMKDLACDYLVDPIYTVDVQSQSNSQVVNFQVELSAFPAKYSKFSQPDSLPKSVMQISSIDTRGLPLYISSKKVEKTASAKEVGGIVGFGLSKELNPSSTDESLMSWNLGLYKSFGTSKPIGFRGELKIVGFGGKGVQTFYDYDVFGNLITNNYEVKRKYTSFVVPLMLSVNLKKINLLAGIIPAYIISDKSVSDNPNYSGGSNSVGADSGVTFGLGYKLNDKLTASYRYEKFQVSGYSNHGFSLAIRFK